MGNNQSNNSSRVSVASNGSSVKPFKVREHKRHGAVILKILNSANTPRRNPENQITHVITPKGSILYGSSVFNNPNIIQNGKSKLY